MTESGWIQQLVGEFGEACRQLLGDVAEDEAAIRRPVEDLLTKAAAHLGFALHLHPEARRPDLGIRPDLAARIGRGRQDIVGYVELKSPGKRDISPGALRGGDRKQWEGMAGLTNLIYTNGQTWTLYRLGQQRGETVRLEGDLYRAGRRLRAPESVAAAFEGLLRDFLSWQPRPLVTVAQLVSHVAPLCKMLRAQVRDKLLDERQGPPDRRRERLFTELAETWELVLFPKTDDRDPHMAFADRYAQTVTFALLLARAEGISLTDNSLHAIGEELGSDHTVMGRALQILTDHVGKDFRNSLDMMVRVVGAADWSAILRQAPGAHIHLYEDFLQAYDPDLRKASGTYYTPAPLADEMVRLVDEVLQQSLACPEGFADPRVAIIDPAMGTGTFLSSVIDLVAERRSAGGNDGFRAEAVEELSRRLIGFEKQMASYAVAQMTIAQTLRAQNADIRLRDLRLHLTDTLADPWNPPTIVGMGGAAMAPLRHNVEVANEIKREERLTVVIGNPPDRERAQGEGGWIEAGSPGKGEPLLEDFRLGGKNGRYENKLKNLYVYFWRWATHKVFKQHRPEQQQGIVCFISTAGFLRGRGFQGMREYLRMTCTEGWIIDLSPEGKQPPVASRFFPGVQRELAIAIFVRRHDESEKDPAPVHYVALRGSREEKLRQLKSISVGGMSWLRCRPERRAPFTPAPESGWDGFPALGDLMPWQKTGVTTNRTWVVGPDPDLLKERWDRMVHEPDPTVRAALLKTTVGRDLHSSVPPLPGFRDPHKPLASEDGDCTEPVPIARRCFDRQWLIPDGRVIDRPRPDLWHANRHDQVFVVEQHTEALRSGPALAFTSLVPDVHYFNNNGGRVLPMRHADETPNLAPGLLNHLTTSYGLPLVQVEDLVAYIAAVTAHPAFTAEFAEDLNSPGIRVPLTADRRLWQRAVGLGRRVLWASTFGERYIDEGEGRPAGAAAMGRLASPSITYARRIAPAPLPTSLAYDADTQTLSLGTGSFTGVDERMRNYAVGHRKVLDNWLSARSLRPTGRTGSPLDRLRSERWRPEWSKELVEILAVLRHLTEAESAQAELLGAVLAGPLIDVAELTRVEVLEAPEHTSGARPPAPEEDMLPGMGSTDGQPPSPVQVVRPPLPDPTSPAPAQRTDQTRSPRARRQPRQR